MVYFTFNAHLVVPCHTRCSVTEELGVNVSWFCNPVVKCILFNGARTRTSVSSSVDDAAFINGHNAVVRISEEALRYWNLIGADTFEDVLYDQFNIVS